jgi:hypothetical protein
MNIAVTVVCWVGICGPVRSNQACSIPVNTLRFAHKFGSREERIGPFSYFNKVPIAVVCWSRLQRGYANVERRYSMRDSLSKCPFEDRLIRFIERLFRSQQTTDRTQTAAPSTP